MWSTLNLCAATALLFLASTIAASPLLERRATVTTVYTYTKAVAVGVQPAAAVLGECTGTVTVKNGCNAGCTGVPMAGLLAVNEDGPWRCLTPAPVQLWTHVLATSTCEEGKAVATVTPWGLKTGVPMCKPTA